MLRSRNYILVAAKTKFSSTNYLIFFFKDQNVTVNSNTGHCVRFLVFSLTEGFIYLFEFVHRNFLFYEV